MAGNARNTLGCLMCATQIAAINGSKVFTRQPLSQGFSLCDTGDTERAIEMSLDTALLIP